MYIQKPARHWEVAKAGGAKPVVAEWCITRRKVIEREFGHKNAHWSWSWYIADSGSFWGGHAFIYQSHRPHHILTPNYVCSDQACPNDQFVNPNGHLTSCANNIILEVIP